MSGNTSPKINFRTNTRTSPEIPLWKDVVFPNREFLFRTSCNPLPLKTKRHLISGLAKKRICVFHSLNYTCNDESKIKSRRTATGSRAQAQGIPSENHQRQNRRATCRQIPGTLQSCRHQPSQDGGPLDRGGDGVKTIESTFTKFGDTFTLLARSGDWCVFKRQSVSKPESAAHFELMKLRRGKEWQIGGRTIPAKEAMPSSEQWGIYGFSYPNKGWLERGIKSARRNNTGMAFFRYTARPRNDFHPRRVSGQRTDNQNTSESI